MDNPIPNQQNVNDLINHSKKTSNPLFIIIILIFFSGLIIAVLSFLKILPISIFFSKQENHPTPINITLTPLKINCPIANLFCKYGETIFKDNQYFGNGYKLSSRSAVFAAFDGVLTSTNASVSAQVDGKSTVAKFKILTLVNAERGFKAEYNLRGDVEKTGQVNKGDKIATLDGKRIAIYNDSSLVFSFYTDYPNSTRPVIIRNEFFE